MEYSTCLAQLTQKEEKKEPETSHQVVFLFFLTEDIDNGAEEMGGLTENQMLGEDGGRKISSEQTHR